MSKPNSGHFSGTAGSRESDKPLPNSQNAVIDPRKLLEYALNPSHPVGKNKAKVFEQTLGFNQSNSDLLISQIMGKLSLYEATRGTLDTYGQRYSVDIPITGPNGQTKVVRTAWIIKTGSNDPELVTLFIKSRKE